MAERLFSAKQAAAILGLSYQTLLRRIRAGRLPALSKGQEPRAQSFSGVKTFNNGIVVPDAGSGHPRQNNNPMMILDEPNNVCYLRSIDGEFEEVAFEVVRPKTSWWDTAAAEEIIQSIHDYHVATED